MRRVFLRVPYRVVVPLAAAIALSACVPRSPEEKVAWLRSLYKARVNGFIVQEEPWEEAELAPEEALGALEGEAVEGEEGEEPVEATPVEQKIMLDILIQHDSPEKLPGITVDISMVDASEQEKGHWRVWFDTSKIAKANPTQFTHILQGVTYQEGDGFSAEVRHPVPVEERSEYREFLSAS